jgi:hypothetical protein
MRHGQVRLSLQRFSNAFDCCQARTIAAARSRGEQPFPLLCLRSEVDHVLSFSLARSSRVGCSRSGGASHLCMLRAEPMEREEPIHGMDGRDADQTGRARVMGGRAAAAGGAASMDGHVSSAGSTRPGRSALSE